MPILILVLKRSACKSINYYIEEEIRKWKNYGSKLCKLANRKQVSRLFLVPTPHGFGVVEKFVL